MSTNNASRSIIKIGGLVLLVVVIRPVVYAIVTYLNAAKVIGIVIPPEAVIRVSMAAVAIITFFGFAWLGIKTGGPLALQKEGSMRLAIVAAIVVTDLVLVTTVIFFPEGNKLSLLGESFLNQFNAIVGVAVAFYFGASAYVQVNNKKDNGGNGEGHPDRPTTSQQ